MVYAPLYPALSEAAIDRLADVIRRHAGASQAAPLPAAVTEPVTAK
jgi:hypothetical protein